ncbi:MAG: helix-turn-helix transcriptional regulator [Alicyclobacillus sp.]|nr:helix-turn-helix transcriptional regulator [Alicyclobacillus sp.]
MKRPTNLKLYLVLHGIKQEWLVQKTGLPSATISRIVNGTTPSLVNALKIARALGVTVEELWGDLLEDN